MNLTSFSNFSDHKNSLSDNYVTLFIEKGEISS